MDLSSVAVILIIAVTIALSFLKRFGMTQMLIVGNLVIFFVTILGPTGVIQADLGFRPIYLQNGENFYTVFTSMFIHDGAAHILFNMLFLFLIGLQLEDRVGKLKFAAVYFAAGLIGVLVESVVRWGSVGLIIGASAAISGTMGAMLLLYPRDRIPMFILIIFLPSVPVWAAVGSWFGLQVFFALSDPLGPTAYSAHIAGFLVGMVVAQYLPAVAKKIEKVTISDVSGLEVLATTPELREALEKVKNETQPDVKRAWLEYFAAHAKCPNCQGGLELKGNKLKCTCDFEVRAK
ncbi:MAG: rhomboid family intramembrane serine protease [Methanomassiliicoccales archaeon]|nr:rhomboid family intramembrane serine protease [Methanomassiliicoccales archaeon]